jgi:sodium/potassium-transporting ATPase subunit alpha
VLQRAFVCLRTLRPSLTPAQIFAVKARFKFPFGKQVISNRYNFAGIFAGACLGIFLIYTPPLHIVFGGSYHLSPLYWLIPIAFGVLLLAWASFRVVLMRRGLEQSRVKDIDGLMMCTSLRSLARSRASR